jgi:transposase
MDHALEEARAGIRDRERLRFAREQADQRVAIGDRRFVAGVEQRDAPVAELVDLREGVELAALVDDLDRAALLDAELFATELPVVDGALRLELRQEVVERGLALADARCPGRSPR